MRYVDRAFGGTLAALILGSLAGSLLTALLAPFRSFMAFLLNTRAIIPVRAASAVGDVAVTLLIFANNCVPVVLSFLYPLIIAKVRWTPPLRDQARNQLLTTFSLLTGGLVGFFNLGATLMLASELGGLTLLIRLLETSWLHGPLEFFFVLVCVAEPSRIVGRRSESDGIVGSMRADMILLLISLIGLLVSASIEVFAGV
ncbi:MAG: hypothetical protein ABSF00_09705 [Candidatus Bathyarchaeia archaeon]